MGMLEQLNALPDKCERCRWPYGGFHICLDLSTPEPEPAIRKMSDWQRARLQEGLRQRWAREAEKTKERNKEIVRLYEAGGIGAPGLAKQFGISRSTVLVVLHKNNVKMRPPGRSVSRPGK